MEAVRIIYRESDEAMKMDPHFHNDYELIFVTGGQAVFDIDSHIYPVGENSLLLINQFENHRLTVREYPYRRYYLLIRPDFFSSVVNEPELESAFRQRPPQFRHRIDLAGDERERLRAILEDLIRESARREDFWEFHCGSLIRMLFVYLYRRHKEAFPLTSMDSAARTVIAVQKYLEARYNEEITLRQTAADFFINMYYLSHLFRRTTGLSFKEYLILLRISRAKDRLFASDDSITDIASGCGFNNVNHFIRIFRQHVGQTPLQYRKAFRTGRLPPVDMQKTAEPDT